MDIRNLGRSGLRVSSIGLGCNNFGWRIDLEGTRAVVHKALDVGITLFDTADIYGNLGGSETLLGQVLGERRKDIVLATKFRQPMDAPGTLQGASRRYIVSAVEASLRRLRTDWIDLYQVHFPDPLTPMEETLRALDDLVAQGKVRYLGLSNHPAWQVADAWWIARTQHLNGFVSCQDEYSLVARDPERELIPAMLHYGLGLLPYFPLASGLLTGKYRGGGAPAADTRFGSTKGLADRYLTERNRRLADLLAAFAEGHGHGMLELAFGWLLSREPVASVIAGATRPEQVEQNAQAGGWRLSAEELAEIDRLSAA
jgi:aryl-alcohol dehydrogenase-like predicted oxidoreductase